MPITTGFYTADRIQLFDMLGFNDTNLIYGEEGYGDSTFFQYTRYVDIVCSQLTNNQALKDTMTQSTARDVLCRVYVGDAEGVQSTVLPNSATFCPPGCAPTTIYKNFSIPKFIQWMPDSPVPGYLRFTVYDQDGYVLRGTGDEYANDWSLTMLVSEN
jgi:hypothetical protein